MQSVNESAIQVSAAVAAEGTPVPAVAAKPGNAKVATTFIGRYKDVDLAAAIARILVAMAGNVAYPSPVPTLATLTTAGDAFVAAVHGNDGGTVAVVRRDQTRASVEELLRELAAYVQHACQGDLLRLLSSGFPAQRQRSAGVEQPLLPPTVVKLRNGNASGQVIARCAHVRSARLYQWRYATAQAPTVWTLEDTTSTIVYTLTGLIPATQYLMQVRAFGKSGASNWSDSVALIAT